MQAALWQIMGLIDELNSLKKKYRLAATRQPAKRQLTWLRSFPDLLRLDAGGAQDPAVALHLLLDEGRQLLGR